MSNYEPLSEREQTLVQRLLGNPFNLPNTFTSWLVRYTSQNVRVNGWQVNGGTVPTGAKLEYDGTTAPAGFLLCDGSLYSRIVLASLFAVIGTTYGVGDGSTTFAVPNESGKIIKT